MKRITINTKESAFAFLETLYKEFVCNHNYVDLVKRNKVYERFSCALVGQLLQIINGVGEVTLKIRIIDDILREVLIMERILNEKSTSKKAQKFKRAPLINLGLSYKHFYNRNLFMRQNIESHFGFNFKDNEQKFSNQNFQNLYEEAASLVDDPNNPSGKEIENFAGKMADELIYGSIEKRKNASKLSGEWIIFKERQNTNYYLMIGLHREDEKIFKEIETIFRTEFNFLIPQTNNKN